jgi:DNA-binding CsgD family transcriptional regulator
MSLRTTELSLLQLQIVMHLSNGMTIGEVAKAVDRSEANVKYHTNQARAKCGAKTLPQLVSVVIAHGELQWSDGQRVLSESHDAAPASGDSFSSRRTGT